MEIKTGLDEWSLNNYQELLLNFIKKIANILKEITPFLMKWEKERYSMNLR